MKVDQKKDKLEFPERAIRFFYLFVILRKQYLIEMSEEKKHEKIL